MPVSPAPDLTEVRRIIGRIHRIPDHFRCFSQRVSDAATGHRIGAPLLETLVDEGLPVIGRGSDRLFDELDLTNISLSLGLRSPRHIAMRGLRNALLRPPSGEPDRYVVTIVPRCPYPGHPGSCDFQVPPNLYQDTPAPVPDDSGTVAFNFTATTSVLSEETVTAPPVVRDILDQLAGLEYHLLPRLLEEDLSFTRDSNLACCLSVTRLLVQEGRRRGCEVRTAVGLLASPPFAAPHWWAEFRVGGSWLAFDPYLISILEQWRFLGPDEWSLYRSPAALLLRLSGTAGPIATHRGMTAEASLYVRRAQ